jgi:hypothetical protein
MACCQRASFRRDAQVASPAPCLQDRRPPEVVHLQHPFQKASLFRLPPGPECQRVSWQAIRHQRQEDRPRPSPMGVLGRSGALSQEQRTGHGVSHDARAPTWPGQGPVDPRPHMGAGGLLHAHTASRVRPGAGPGHRAVEGTDQRCMGRAICLAACGVEWRSVPLRDVAATCTHAWLTGLPLARARPALDGRPTCRASCVDWDGPRAPHGCSVAQANTPCATAARDARPEPREGCGAGPLLVPKPER